MGHSPLCTASEPPIARLPHPQRAAAKPAPKKAKARGPVVVVGRAAPRAAPSRRSGGGGREPPRALTVTVRNRSVGGGGGGIAKPTRVRGGAEIARAAGRLAAAAALDAVLSAFGLLPGPLGAPPAPHP